MTIVWWYQFSQCKCSVVCLRTLNIVIQYFSFWHIGVSFWEQFKLKLNSTAIQLQIKRRKSREVRKQFRVSFIETLNHSAYAKSRKENMVSLLGATSRVNTINLSFWQGQFIKSRNLFVSRSCVNSVFSILFILRISWKCFTRKRSGRWVH